MHLALAEKRAAPPTEGAWGDVIDLHVSKHTEGFREG